MMRKYLLLIFAAGLFLLTGCQHKELCYNHNHTVQVNVVFDWTKSPGADPKSMVVYLFPEDGSDPLLYQLSGAAGGTITVPLGRYQMLALNSDTESILYRGAGLLSSFEIYTRDENISTGMGLSEQSEVPRASGTEQEPVKLAPDMVWSGRYSEEVEFSLDEPVKEVVFTPEPDVIDCSVEILNVKNLDKIIQVSGVISGMSSSVFMEQPKRSESTCTIPFTVKSDGVSTLTARLLTFGHCPGTVVNKHILTIYYVMSDGSKWYYSVDVTDQLHKAGADPQHIVIVLDNIPVPDPINPGGGFNIDVGGWNNVYVDLPIM